MNRNHGLLISILSEVNFVVGVDFDQVLLTGLLYALKTAHHDVWGINMEE